MNNTAVKKMVAGNSETGAAVKKAATVTVRTGGAVKKMVAGNGQTGPAVKKIVTVAVRTSAAVKKIVAGDGETGAVTGPSELESATAETSIGSLMRAFGAEVVEEIGRIGAAAGEFEANQWDGSVVIFLLRGDSAKSLRRWS